MKFPELSFYKADQCLHCWAVSVRKLELSLARHLTMEREGAAKQSEYCVNREILSPSWRLAMMNVFSPYNLSSLHDYLLANAQQTRAKPYQTAMPFAAAV